MHPLHEYVAKQLAQHLRDRHVVVWYDPRREFAPFIDELRGGSAPTHGVTTVAADGVAAKLAEFTGSFFEVRALIEPLVCGDTPDDVIAYVPGIDRDRRGSVLMEMEKAGEAYEPQLKRLARNVLRQRYTDGVIDDMLKPDAVSYEDLARASSDSTTGPPSILKVLFHDAQGGDALLAEWLVREERDVDIDAKGGAGELTKLIGSRLGLEAAGDTPVAKLRSLTIRYVLGGDFRADLRCPPPASLAGVPTPRTKEQLAAVRDLARRLRVSSADAYETLADRVEAELGLRDAALPPDSLGSVDTFRFEERALLGYCGGLIAAGRFEAARVVVAEREGSFWLERDVSRKAQWEACRRMAELGSVAESVRAAIGKVSGDADAWVDAYTAKDGWHRLDHAQRRLETWVASSEDDPNEKALGVVRRLYEDVCHAMAEGFTRALVKSHWTVQGALHQTRIFPEVVAARPKPVAYIFVDAMRFEMGLELVDRLPKSAEVSARPAMAVLPSITPLGMAALLPGAAGSFSVVTEGGKLGSRVEEAFLPDLAARKKFVAGRVPNLVDITLDELFSLQPSKLEKRLKGAEVVVVRSQEIDHAGETGFTNQARQVMDTVIDNLARAITRLAKAGVEQSVVTADHGHFFFATDRDESMRTNAPGGETVELHRRCWIGRGGSTPPGCVRVAASELGYASDLEFVFPAGAAVFRAGGDLAFHHGGPSLQEMVVPVLTVRLKIRESVRPTATPVTVASVPDAVTNRIFSVSLQLGQSLALFSSSLLVRPMLLSGGRQVGTVGMVVGGERDPATGCVTLQPGKPVTVAFLLTDDSVPSLRVVVQDPASDADLYRSSADIPVRLST